MASARFHLPGLRYNYPLNMFWVSLKKKYPDYFREGVEIASFFGAFPVSLWNGGRFSNRDQCDEKFVRMVIKSINGQVPSSRRRICAILSATCAWRSRTTG